MNVLIAFGTTEGQTRKIARHMARLMLDSGHDVELHDCSSRIDAPNVGDFDVVVLAASVHHKRYQTTFYSLLSRIWQQYRPNHWRLCPSASP